MNREILFPTPIYFKMVKDPQKMNDYLFPLIKAWREKKEKKAGAYQFLLILSKRKQLISNTI